VAGVALGDIDYHFAWKACHLRHGAGSGGAPGSQMTPWRPRLFAWQAWRLETSTFTLRGRRGTWRGSPSFRVAGVALGETFVLCGRWGTYGTGLPLVGAWARLVAGDAAALCVAGVALVGDIHLRFAWQAWHLETSTFVLRGRCSTCGTGLALVAGTTFSHTTFHTHHL